MRKPKPLNQLDLNLLVVLNALLAERSVTHAGERLALSQPATSAALGRLREFFGDPLLVRTGRRLEPTAFALGLQQPVQDILRRIEQTIDARSAFDPLRANRELTIAASDYSTLILGPALHAAASSKAPNLRLRFVSLEAAAATRASADLFVLPESFARGHHEELFRDRWVFIADRNNLEIGARLSSAALRRLPFIRFTSPRGTVLDGALDAIAFERPPAITVASFGAALLLVPGTRFVTLCQERLTRIARIDKQLRVLKAPLAIPPLIEVMAWNPVQDSDPAHTWLRGLVRGVAASLKA